MTVECREMRTKLNCEVKAYRGKFIVIRFKL